VDPSPKGTVQRAALALEALFAILRTDPRVQRAYEAWRVAPLPRPDLTPLLAELGLPAQLAHQLLQDFLGRALDRAALHVTPGIDLDTLPGRLSKNDGGHIRRDVSWYYRAKIKLPPDSINALGREEALRTGNPNARTKVQAGIKRAEELLAIFGIEGEPK
jgi:hypothetical protein